MVGPTKTDWNNVHEDVRASPAWEPPSAHQAPLLILKFFKWYFAKFTLLPSLPSNISMPTKRGEMRQCYIPVKGESMCKPERRRSEAWSLGFGRRGVSLRWEVSCVLPALSVRAARRAEVDVPIWDLWANRDTGNDNQLLMYYKHLFFYLLPPFGEQWLARNLILEIHTEVPKFFNSAEEKSI